jgi:Tfp pilus assembly protein PilF
MRVVVLLATAALALAQSDPAYEPLTRAYTALRAHDYDTAIPAFLQAVEAAPRRAAIRKDLGYTYLKIGETTLARDQFQEAVSLDPADTQVALEYAFLCYETKEQAKARRIFDRIRKTGNATAEQAFRNIDTPLAEGITRWQNAIQMGADNFSAHFELATLAEQRDQLPLAAEHFEKAWRLLPDRRSVLVDLGRVWLALDRPDEASAALLAASRGGEPRAAEMARELLPARYPFIPEFRRALALDPANVELRRELGYLLLRMDRAPEAEQEFRLLTRDAPDDLLAATQLGFLLFSRGEQTAATPLFERVMAGKDDDLANRVRAVLHLPLVLKVRDLALPPASIDAKVMAERSIKAGYMKDAVKYLVIAHESDPGDFDVMLKLGWSYNLLHQDAVAFRWFDLARKSADPKIAAEAAQAWHNLRDSNARFRTTAWLFPVFSTRWHDFFSYGQVKTELRTSLPLRPYISVRFVGDTRLTIGAVSPQSLSESSFIAGVGMRTLPWRGITAWAEAGSAISYLKGHMLPDYRAGISTARALGHTLTGESPGWFTDTTIDALFVSRFNNDFLVYDQTRLGYTFGPKSYRTQFHWNANLTFDSSGQYWANFVETGPGIRFTSTVLPSSMYFTFNLLRGAYLTNAGNPRRPNFNDFRAGFWYAFTR